MSHYKSNNNEESVVLSSNTETQLISDRKTSISQSIRSGSDKSKIASQSLPSYDRCTAENPYNGQSSIQSEFRYSISQNSSSSLNYLNPHIQLHNGDKPYQCGVNDLSSTNSASLARNTEENSYKCTVCEKRFCHSEELMAHSQTHDGEDSLYCKVCEKRFTQMRTFSLHMRTHSEKSPYKCTVCDKGFLRQTQCTDHMRTHMKEKPLFTCAFCEKKYTKNSNLIIHMRTHTGEKPFECIFCDKAFGIRQTLTRHLRIHTGEKPYKCTVCDKRFARQTSLTEHMC